MRGIRLFVTVGLVGCVLTDGAFAQAKSEASAFATTVEAYAAWQKAPDEAGRRAALDWLETNARSCPASVLSDALLHYGRASTADARDAFLAVCAKRGAPEAAAADRQTVALQLADWHSAAGEHEAAVAALNAHLKSDDLPLTLRAAAVRKAAQLMTDQLGRAADGAALLASAADVAPPEREPAVFADLLNARAAILQTALHDRAGAEAETRRVLALGDACPVAAYAVAVDRLAALLVESGQTNAIPPTLLLLFRHAVIPAAGSARKLIDSGASPAQLEEAVGLLRARAVATFLTIAELQTRAERVQPELAELLLALGRPEEAVRECRVYALSASDRTYPLAIDLAARCLKALDGNLARANGLLEFHGVTPPAADARNPLLSFPALADPVRAEAARQPDPPPADWTAWMNRAALFSWLDRPIDSMDAARTAFSCCPMASNTLQICANAVARPVLVATRDTALGQRLTDFLLFGAGGPDGRPGTEDDIADPFPEARKRLAYGMAAEAAQPQ